MQTPWELWKRAFYTWEGHTAKYMDDMLRNPAVLWPGGKALGGAMKLKAQSNKMMTNMWSNLGLPNKRDQERTLHALNQLQSKIYDLEERLEALQSDSQNSEAK